MVGLTGGIGSGKSTVARMLANMGAVILDADALARKVTEAGGVAIPAVKAEFGADFITLEGALDRKRMRDLAFHDASARHRLEAIIHPLVGQMTGQQARQAIEDGRPCVVFDIPLLVESGHWRTKLNRVIVVDCDEETQIERVMTRSGMGRADVELIIGSQARRDIRLSAADIVLSNQDVSLESLGKNVAQLAEPFGLSLANWK